jgi:hypothetical protein
MGVGAVLACIAAARAVILYFIIRHYIFLLGLGVVGRPS